MAIGMRLALLSPLSAYPTDCSRSTLAILGPYRSTLAQGSPSRPLHRLLHHPPQALKHFPKEHPQHGSFQQAFVLSQKTVTEINEQVAPRSAT